MQEFTKIGSYLHDDEDRVYAVFKTQDDEMFLIEHHLTPGTKMRISDGLAKDIAERFFPNYTHLKGSLK